MSTYLPEDVVLKILSMLPAKSLLRFRCVCKSWLFLIGTPDLLSNNLFNHSIINNTTTCTTPHQLLLVKRTVESTPRTQTRSFLSYHTLALLSQTVLDLPQTPREPKIVGSCNGLLCLFDHDIFVYIFVYNPATSELKALPPASNVDSVCFGFDSKRNEFKVMRIRYVPIREPPVLQTDREVQVLRLNRVAEVYSLNSGCSWRKLINMVDNDDVPCSSTPSWAYANGVCFWCDFNDEKVVAFDASDEVFQTTPLPDAISLAWNRFEYGRTFTVLNELVAMIVFPKNEKEETCFNIWVLFEFGVKESWTRLVRIGGFLGLERPLGFWKNGELFVENREGQLVLCDPFTQRVRNLHVDGVKGSLQVLYYTQSSVSIEESNNSRVPN